MDTASRAIVHALFAAWARLHTIGLTATQKRARIEELTSDVWEHEHDPDVHRRWPGAVAVELVGRLVRGIPADLAWRRAANRSPLHPDVPRNGSRLMSSLHDLRAVARQMYSDGAHTVVVVATLATGIVAATIVFSVVNAVLLDPLPYPDADRLALLRIDIAGIEQHPGMLRAEAARVGDLDSVEAVGVVGRPFRAAVADQPMFALTGAVVSTGMFPMLGVVPERGRLFTEQDVPPDAPSRALISHRAWQTRFGADPEIVGKTIASFGGTEIVGVLPPGFRLDAGRGSAGLAAVDIWYPLFVNPDEFNFWGFRTIVRLAPGALDQARAELNALGATLQAERPDAYGDTAPNYYVEPLHADLTRDVRPQIWALFATVGVVLLLACTSAAGLITARARQRLPEYALRSALGAPGGLLLRQMLLQSVAIGMLVAAVAIPASWRGVPLFLGLEPGNLPRAADVGVDARVLAFGIALALLASLMAGCLPAWQASRVQAASVLEHGSRTVGGRLRRGTRGALVVGQLAFCFALLVSAGLLARTFANLSAVEPGFRHEDVLTAEIGIDWTLFPERADRWGAYRRLVDRVASLPGVEAAGAISHVPLGARGLMASFSTTGFPETSGWSGDSADFRFVTQGYFDALGMALVSGRAISADDNEQLRRVVVIDSLLAARGWPGEDPVGKRMHVGIDGVDPAIADPTRNDWFEVEIVGVVEHPRIGDLRADGRPQIYLPQRYRGEVPMTIAARVSGDRAQVADGIRDAAAAIGFNWPVESFRMLGEYVDEHRATARFLITLLGALAVVAVVLAVVGVYGVVAYMAGERRGEIGIRKALGAGRGTLIALNVREGGLMAALGIAVGVLAAPALGGTFTSVLYGVPPLDPYSYAGAALLLLGISVLASLVPALRASRAPSSEVLRSS